jgi:hypothetical protein
LVECAGNFTPQFTVRNAGLVAITGFVGNYSINGGAPVTTTFTGLNIAPGASQTLNLTAAAGLPTGVHTIRMYATALTTAGGAGDQNLSNDTVAKQFSILGTVAAPLVQNFDALTTSAAGSGWGLNNPDNGTTWALNNANASAGLGKSASIANFSYLPAGPQGAMDELITPNVTFSNVDSVFVSFDLAAATRKYPGSTVLNLDTVEVLVSKDCGATGTVVFKKWGEDLQTIDDPNYSNTVAFTPTSASQWKNIKLNVTAATGTTSTGVVFFFRNKSNGDNNVYIDNINISTLTHPTALKQEGYVISPTPFNTSFNVQHLLPPTDMRYIEVFDARGRLVYRKQFGVGGASSNERINLDREAAGIYTVKLGYANKVISERIIKAN